MSNHIGRFTITTMKENKEQEILHKLLSILNEKKNELIPIFDDETTTFIMNVSTILYKSITFNKDCEYLLNVFDDKELLKHKIISQYEYKIFWLNQFPPIITYIFIKYSSIVVSDKSTNFLSISFTELKQFINSLLK